MYGFSDLNPANTIFVVPVPVAFVERSHDWAANVQRHFVAPKPWPELAHKQETLTFCAAILRTAIDLNEIELACGQLTNQPEAAAVLKNFSKAVTSNLNEFADMLADPEITTSVGSEGYRAELSKSRYNYIFTFGTTNKLPSAVRSFNKRLPDNSLVMGGDFYENGKLRSFNLQPKGRGRHGNSGLYFTEDGKLARYWIAPKEIAP